MYNLASDGYVQNISSLNFEGGAGSDTVWNNTDLPSTLRGHGGNDKLSGGSGKDLIQGGGGSDVLYGNAGDDTLHAHIGFVGTEIATNWLYGGNGNDLLVGADGARNEFYGGQNEDTLWGGDGAVNYMQGQTGNDTYYAGNNCARNFIKDNKGKEVVHCGDSSYNAVNVVDGNSGPAFNDKVLMGLGSVHDIQKDPFVNLMNPGDSIS